MEKKEQIIAQINAVGQKCHLNLSNEQCTLLFEYITLLEKWNKTFNLTAIHSFEDMLVRHLYDCLAICSYLKDKNRILDVGTGAGLPGIVLAIVYSQKKITLIDTVQKKTSFLQQVKTQLNLKNVQIETKRVEKFQDNQLYDAIISRAFSSLKQFVELTNHLLEKEGIYFAMKGLIPTDEISNLDLNQWEIIKQEQIVVPQLQENRHLIMIQRKMLGK